MTDWKPLTAENLVRAQCIFVSEDYCFSSVKDPEFLRKYKGESWIEKNAEEAIKEVEAGVEYEFIFNVLRPSRYRMYVYPREHSLTREKFPDSEYSIGITNMGTIDDPRYYVETRFSRIEKALLNERFPAIKF